MRRTYVNSSRMPQVIARSMAIVPVESDRIEKLQRPLPNAFRRILRSERAREIGKVLVGIGETDRCGPVPQSDIRAPSSRSAPGTTVLSKRSSDVVPSNVATATELSKESWSQRTFVGCGVIDQVSLDQAAGRDSPADGTSCGARRDGRARGTGRRSSGSP